ncbi:MAG: hypothetical protein QM726_06080 [Chitinophagaceae bacterium]
MVSVLLKAGGHVPVMLWVDIVGNATSVAQLVMGAICVNDAVIFGLTLTMLVLLPVLSVKATPLFGAAAFDATPKLVIATSENDVVGICAKILLEYRNRIAQTKNMFGLMPKYKGYTVSFFAKLISQKAKKAY